MGQVTVIYIFVEGIAEMLDPLVPTVRAGGVESQMAQLAVELAARDGVEVVIITDQEFRHPEITVRVVPRYMRRGPYRWSQLLYQRVARALFRDLLGGSPERKVALFPRTLNRELIEAARSQGCFSAHWVAGDSLVDDTPLQKTSPDVLDRQRCLPLLDVVLALTSVQVAHLRERFGIEAHLVPNLIAEPTVDWAIGERSTVLWVGRPVLLKRPLLFVEIARQLPEYRFEMIMQSQPENRELREILEYEEGRLDNFSVAYDVSYDDMVRHYIRARAVVGTSVTEGVPQVYLEAGALGIPVYSLDVNPNEMYPIGEPNQLGFFADGNLPTLIDELRSLLAGGSDSEATRRAIHDATMAGHSAPLIADSILGIFERADRG